MSIGKQKNMYDLAGNVEEWVFETFWNSVRVTGGGRYGDEFFAGGNASGRGDATISVGLLDVGFRPALYIK